MNPGNTHAKGGGRRGREGRNIVRDGSLAEITIALVAGRDESLHVSIGREHPSRYSLGPAGVIGQRIAVHVHPFGWRGTCWPALPDDQARPDRWYPPADSHPRGSGTSTGRAAAATGTARRQVGHALGWSACFTRDRKPAQQRILSARALIGSHTVTRLCRLTLMAAAVMKRVPQPVSGNLLSPDSAGLVPQPAGRYVYEAVDQAGDRREREAHQQLHMPGLPR